MTASARKRTLQFRDIDAEVLAMLEALAVRVREQRPGSRVYVADLARQLLLASGKDGRLLRRLGLPPPPGESAPRGASSARRTARA